MYTQSYQPELTSPTEAIRIGYTEGAECRKNGALPHDLEFNIGAYQGNYPRSPFYRFWRKGFEAGFIGERQPTVPQGPKV